ncbi:DUF3352 domain-containing protein [Phormidesmis priestleyi ULC007]|uniref:DUF3352 domain-containing protein n=1 Tax=Phormidesmis priestleyi ULC007 TaxID=1920490 RepID=A0A2T1DL66_9CYAN|nr:DUF3352 domain-containing protein [Phormidesmis priestleyi]PSB21226.1 DUF3352 domain-containing protein [Phormidesmis priestleyi ULC007]PZO51246.1 MAG: DUF3352 domain-containing protein [Phormidesmis priestleyi]
MSLRRTLLPALSALILAPNFALAETVPNSVANLLPSDTAGVLLINTEAKTWEELSRFGLFPADFSFPGSFYPIQAGLNFSTDIQPWLGNQVAIAFLPLKSHPDRSLTIASVKDTTLIPKFLERLKAARKEAAIEHNYKGITILEWQPKKPTVTPCEKESEQKPCSEALRQPFVLGDISRSFSTAAKPDALTVPLPHLPTPEKNAGIESPFAPKGLAIAILPGYVVTAFTVEPIQQLIDAQGLGKLADNPLFQRTIRQPQFQRSFSGESAQPLITGYGDYAQILTAATTFNQAQINALPPGFPIPPKLDPEKLDVLGRYYDVMDGFVWAQPDGLHMQVGIHFKQAVPQSLLNSMTTRNQILDRLPEVNYVASNGQNLALFWQVFTTGLESDPSTKKGLDQFRQFSQRLVGLDDRDIFPWMNGEIATFMYPTRQGFLPATFPNLDLGFGLMIQTRDRAAAEAALSKLDRVAQTRIDKDLVNTRTIQGQPVTTWNVPANGKTVSLLSHSWVNKDTVLILGGGGTMTEFVPKPLRSLPQSANFKAAIAPFSNANLGYFYVNGGAVMSLVNRSIMPFLSGGKKNPGLDAVKESLGSIRSLSGASSVTSEKVQSEGFMALATTRKTPLTASQLIELGQTKLEGDPEGAIANFTRAIQLDPNNAEVYYKRGLARSLTDVSAAIADYTQALRIDSKSVKAYLERSSARERLFDYVGARQDLDQAIQLVPDDDEFYLKRSKVRIVQGDYQGAIADANQAIRLETNSSQAYGTRCYARARGLGDFKGALVDCDQAIALDPESLTSFTSRCYVRANLNDKKALEDCDLALEIDPEYSAIYEDRGLAYAALGNKKAALEDLQKAVEIFKQQGDIVSQQRVEKAIEKLS